MAFGNINQIHSSGNSPIVDIDGAKDNGEQLPQCLTPQSPSRSEQEAQLAVFANAFQASLMAKTSQQAAALGKMIDMISVGNTDSDKSKLSTEELITGMQKQREAMMADPAKAAMVKNNSKAIENDCLDAGNLLLPATDRTVTAVAIAKYGNSAVNILLEDLQLERKLAADINNHEAVKRDIKEYAHNKATIFADMLKDNYPSLTSYEITAKLEPVFAASATQAKDVLKEHPEIAKSLVSMPDFSEIGLLNAEQTCRMFTGKGVGGVPAKQ